MTITLADLHSFTSDQDRAEAQRQTELEAWYARLHERIYGAPDGQYLENDHPILARIRPLLMHLEVVNQPTDGTDAPLDVLIPEFIELVYMAFRKRSPCGTYLGHDPAPEARIFAHDYKP